MELFCVKAAIHLHDTFNEFAQVFSLSDSDLVLTESVIYDHYIRNLDLPCSVILKDRYSAGEPDEETVDRILVDMKDMNIQRVIAVGGGSVIDIAKVICVKDAYPIRRVMNHEIQANPDKILVVVPTTCGTGSEVTYGGIITMKDTGLKTAIMDSTLVSSYAVLIPELLEGLPYNVFMHCSIDALGHSMESYVSATRGNEMARAVGARAIKILAEGYADLAACGKEKKKELLKNFIMASCMGGMAVNNGGAGPVHALAYPLGEIYHMSHGESIYQFLPEVFCLYEKRKSGVLLRELESILRPSLKKAGIECKSAFEGLGILLEKICPRRSLTECGMKVEEAELFAESIFAAKQRLLAASYTEFHKEDAVNLYRMRLG